MKNRMLRNDIKEAVKRVVYGKETIEAVVRDLKKEKDISVKQLENWVKERTGIMTAKDRIKAVSCVLNNNEEIEVVANRINVPKETLNNWIKTHKRSKEIEAQEMYHQGIRRDDYKGNIYNRFKMDIGIKLSTIRFTEIMYREFCKTNSDVFDDLSKAEKLGKEYRINFNHADKETTYNQIALNYLVIIHECFDNYLNNLLALIKEGSRKEFKKKRDKETVLDCILDNINCSPMKNEDFYKLCNYYRLVRNAYIHDARVEDPPQIEIELPNKEVVKPNAFHKIDYKDADLFSYIALELGKKIYYLIDLDIEKIIEKRGLYKKLRLGKYGAARREQKLMRHLDDVLPNEKEKMLSDVRIYLKKR